MGLAFGLNKRGVHAAIDIVMYVACRPSTGSYTSSTSIARMLGRLQTRHVQICKQRQFPILTCDLRKEMTLHEVASPAIIASPRGRAHDIDITIVQLGAALGRGSIN